MTVKLVSHVGEGVVRVVVLALAERVSGRVATRGSTQGHLSVSGHGHGALEVKSGVVEVGVEVGVVAGQVHSLVG